MRESRGEEAVEIDGSTGGGQLLRTALTLSAITGTPFRMQDVRRTRPTPGLRPQHLAGVRLVADFCGAKVSGATLDSQSVTFRPGAVRPKSTRIDVGTAGSVTLLFDTVLPLSASVPQPYHLTATGGTDVKWAPTADYYRWVKLPLLRRYGLRATADVAKTGFYPSGGGEVSLRTEPSRFSPIRVTERGAFERVDIYSKAATRLAERNVADRQAVHARTRLRARNVPTRIQQVEYVPSSSLGSSVLLRGVYENTLVGFDELGERGRTSEEVAESAVDAFLDFHRGDGAVDEHMADQSMIFLALHGGRVRIPTVTAHVRANLDVIRQFGGEVRVVREDDAIFLEASSALLAENS